MKNTKEERAWKSYRDRELAEVSPILERLGFVLELEQPHIQGERYFMQAVTTAHGKKLILLAHRTNDGKRVVIKTTSDPDGAKELLHERECREVLHKINFAYDIFFSPEELLFERHGKYTISVQAFLEQECPFLERPLEEQFALALKAFKAQESAHAATYEHKRLIEKTFGSRNAEQYLALFIEFKKNILQCLHEQKDLHTLLEQSEVYLKENERIIEQYSGFLTHVDFVPHNFRIIGDDIYLLDHSSLRFGNKYEGWARFLNFMTLYNPPLQQALTEYVKNNRTEEEFLSLKLLRIYRLGEIIWYYTNTLSKSSGDLHVLNTKRIEFWSHVLATLLKNTPVQEEVIGAYKKERDALRSDEEKQRQIGLH